MGIVRCRLCAIDSGHPGLALEETSRRPFAPHLRRLASQFTWAQHPLISALHIHSTACATILLYRSVLHPNRGRDSRPDRRASAPQLSCSTRSKRVTGYTTPQHPRSVRTDRRRAKPCAPVTDESLAVVWLLACGTANVSGD